MPYDNSEAAIPTRIATAALLNALLDNLDYHRGVQAGQTDIQLQAELSTPAVRSEGADFEFRRYFDNTADGGSNVAEFVLKADDRHTPSSIEDGYALTLVQRIEETQTPNACSITNDGVVDVNGFVTATVTLNGHGYSGGESVVIDGATQGAYNGEFVITGTTANTFTYEMASDPAPASPATGSPTCVGVPQDLSEIIATREEENAGSLALRAIGAFGGDDLFLDAITGFLAVETEAVPEVALDIGSGAMDVPGDYRQEGAVLNDWTETLGPPDKLSWAGRAQTTQQFRSTVATGTAPISLSGSSTTLCPNLDGEYLDGFGWHDGISALGSAAFTTSDTDIVSLALDRAGKWSVRAACIAVDESATAGTRNIDLWLEDGSGTAIGRVVRVTSVDYGDVCAMPKGPYTSAAGNETIKLQAHMNSGTDGSCTAYLVATWEGP